MPKFPRKLTFMSANIFPSFRLTLAADREPYNGPSLLMRQRHLTV